VTHWFLLESRDHGNIAYVYVGGRGKEETKEGGEEGGGRPRPAGFATYLYFQLCLIAINI